MKDFLFTINSFKINVSYFLFWNFPVNNFIVDTIIFSIHQPRYSIFKLFNKILLMCNGNIIYQDSSKAMLSYFKKQGFQREEHDNPADFVLDVLIDISRMPKALEELHDAYLRSRMHRETDNALAKQWANSSLNSCGQIQKTIIKRSRLREIFYVSRRTLQNSIRNPALFLSQVVVAVMLGLLIGLVFFNLGREINKDVGNRLGAIFIIVTSHALSSLTALESLIQDRVLFVHVSFSREIENLNMIYMYYYTSKI